MVAPKVHKSEKFIGNEHVSYKKPRDVRKPTREELSQVLAHIGETNVKHNLIRDYAQTVHNYGGSELLSRLIDLEKEISSPGRFGSQGIPPEIMKLHLTIVRDIEHLNSKLPKERGLAKYDPSLLPKGVESIEVKILREIRNLKELYSKNHNKYKAELAKIIAQLDGLKQSNKDRLRKILKEVIKNREEIPKATVQLIEARFKSEFDAIKETQKRIEEATGRLERGQEWLDAEIQNLDEHGKNIIKSIVDLERKYKAGNPEYRVMLEKIINSLRSMRQSNSDRFNNIVKKIAELRDQLPGEIVRAIESKFGADFKKAQESLDRIERGQTWLNAGIQNLDAQGQEIVRAIANFRLEYGRDSIQYKQALRDILTDLTDMRTKNKDGFDNVIKSITEMRARLPSEIVTALEARFRPDFTRIQESLARMERGQEWLDARIENLESEDRKIIDAITALDTKYTRDSPAYQTALSRIIDTLDKLKKSNRTRFKKVLRAIDQLRKQIPARVLADMERRFAPEFREVREGIARVERGQEWLDAKTDNLGEGVGRVERGQEWLDARGKQLVDEHGQRKEEHGKLQAGVDELLTGQKELDEKVKKLAEEKPKEEPDKKPAKPEEKKDDDKKKDDKGGKKEEKKGSAWADLTGFALTLGIPIAAIILLASLGLGFGSHGGGTASKVVAMPVAPVVGSTAKSLGSSLFSGSINPLVIVLILLGLFLLFPKK